MVILAEIQLQCMSNFLRLPCQRAVTFSMRLGNIALDHFVFESIDFVELSECQAACLANEYCKSINYNYFGDNTCELNAEKVNSFTDTLSGYTRLLIVKIGWTYMTTGDKDSVNCH